MTNELAFLRVERQHLDALLGFVAKYYAYDGIAFHEASVRRGVLELLVNPHLGGAWLIREADRFVGHFVLAYSVDLEFGGRQATLTEIYLEEGARRRGLGTSALRFIEETLRAAGIHVLELQVEEDNAEARAFYARAGFEAHTTRIPMSKRLQLGAIAR